MGISSEVIFFLLIFLLALTGTISLVIHLYKVSYKRYLDKRIAEHSLGKIKKKKMSPLNFAIACLLSAFYLAITPISALMLWTGLRRSSDESVLRECKPLMIDSPEFEFLKGYSPADEIPGYNRYTTANGEDTLVYYIAGEPNAVSPQLMFCLVTDLPRYYYGYRFQIDNSSSFLLGTGSVHKESSGEDGYGWFGFSFPFNFSDTKKYYSELCLEINGQPMLRLPMNDIAHDG